MTGKRLHIYRRNGRVATSDHRAIKVVKKQHRLIRRTELAKYVVGNLRRIRRGESASHPWGDD